MASFTTTVHVLGPPDRAFAFVVDLTKWPLFCGYGPLPGIAEARADGPVALGTRVRVRNTDGTTHDEVVRAFAPPVLYETRMELVPPASSLMRHIDERVEMSPTVTGTRIVRRFDMVPRSPLLAPLVWLVSLLLRRAIHAHDRAVAAALGAG